MFKLDRILVPTDFSDAANHALPHAFEMARRFASDLTLVHIETPFASDPNHPGYECFDQEKYAASARRELTARSKSVDFDGQISTLVKRNISAAAGILEVVEEGGVDLVVMGTQGKSSVVRFFLGSVAEKVVRYASVPVLTIAPASPGYRDRPAYRRILATFDFSRHSRKAARRAGEMAQEYGADLLVLYVIEQGVHLGFHKAWRKSVSEDLPSITVEAERSVTETLKEAGVGEHQLFVEVGTGEGRAHKVITNFAADQDVDLIVMGTHGLSGFEHMLLGSTTERVVRTSPCPVLTFHLSDQDS